MRFTVALVAVFLCSCALTPYECRTVGVNVRDGDTQTGIIESVHSGDIAKVSANCQSPFRPRRGCAIPLGENRYRVWHDNTAYTRDHEYCHALYEEGEHISTFIN